MKTPLPTLAASTALLALTASSASAISWGTTNAIEGIEEMAQLSDVTVDSTGRVHTVAVADVGIGKTIWYEMRANASAGFAESGERKLVKITTAGRAPRSVSIGVTDDFTAQIAMVDETGRLFVYELPRSADSWEETNLGDNGWGDRRTGVSIESRGDGGFTRSMIAYTKRATTGTNSDGVALLEQRDGGSWTAQGNAVIGAGSGMAPRLINMDTTARLPETRRVVVYYNDSSKAGRISARRARKWRWPLPSGIPLSRSLRPRPPLSPGPAETRLASRSGCHLSPPLVRAFTTRE